MVLFRLSTCFFPSPRHAGFCLATALVHLLSPAGLFLSAPYAESACALMTFTGQLLFVQSQRQGRYASDRWQDLSLVASGIAFGLATTLRSNGILNGILLLLEALDLSRQVVLQRKFVCLPRLVAAGLGGLAVALGFVYPQYLAYIEYCVNPVPALQRPWCEKTIPSIYTFVQSHYWWVIQQYDAPC